MSFSVEQNTAAQLTTLAYHLAEYATRRQMELDPTTAWSDAIHQNARELLPEIVHTYYEATRVLRGEDDDASPTADFVTP